MTAKKSKQKADQRNRAKQNEMQEAAKLTNNKLTNYFSKVSKIVEDDDDYEQTQSIQLSDWNPMRKWQC